MLCYVQRGERFASRNAEQASVETVGPAMVHAGQAGATAYRFLARHEPSTAMTACVEEHANSTAGIACHQQRQPRNLAGKHGARRVELVLMSEAKRHGPEQYIQLCLVSLGIGVDGRGKSGLCAVPLRALPNIPFSYQSLEQPLPGLPAGRRMRVHG